MTDTLDPPVAPTAVTVAGREVTLPVRVRDARMFGAQFLVDADAAQRLVEPTGLAVARFLGGRAVCSVTVVEYVDNDLGDYNEIAVAINVLPHDEPGATPSVRVPVTYIHRLPVDQDFTCAAGRAIWGFPKWVTTITVGHHGRRSEGVLHDEGEFVLGLRVHHSPIPLPDIDLPMTCYSFGDGVRRRTPWHTSNQRVRARPGGAVLELGSRHPMATELRSLGLPRRAVMSLTTGRMEASFGLPERC